MSDKIIKASYPQKCTGCEMCVIQCQHQLKKTGTEGSLIRIFRKKLKTKNKFNISIDPRVNKLDIEKIKDSCPWGVFTIEEENIDKK